MENTPENSKWIKIATVDGDIYAEMIREALENAEIPCEIVRSMMSSGLGAHSVSLANNPATLKVPEKHAQRAQEIVDAILGEAE
jgi:hypothetical protein